MIETGTRSEPKQAQIGLADSASPASQAPKRSIQDWYPEGYSHCYGCGRNNAKGLHVRSFEDGDDFVAQVAPCKDEISHPGTAYAGYVASLLDCHAVAAASAAAHRARGHAVGDGEIMPFMTAELKVEFVRPTPAGVPYELRARALFVQGHKVIAKAELRAGDRVCARAEVHAVEIPGAPKAHHRAR